MPKLVRECGDVLLLGHCGAMFGPALLMLLLCVQVSLIGVLKVLPGVLMSGQVVFFSVVLSAGSMGVDRKVAVLRGDLL